MSGLNLTFNGDDDVADLVARACHERDGAEPPWDMLSGRARKRCRERAKRWLNRAAVDRMMPWLLDERDQNGDVRGWLAAVVRQQRRLPEISSAAGRPVQRLRSPARG